MASKVTAWGVLFTTGYISPVLGKLRAAASLPPFHFIMGWRGPDGSEFQTTRFQEKQIE